jgi:hypothetical protein
LDRAWQVAYPDFAIRPDAGSVSLSGSLLTADEASVRAGGAALTLTLAGDRFRPSLDRGATAAVLRGVASSQREAFGWSTVVSRGLTDADLSQVDLT